jgi:hypothetical protein
MSPQMLILRQLSQDIYHFYAENCNFQKNIGPIEDSMCVSIAFQIDSASPDYDIRGQSSAE